MNRSKTDLFWYALSILILIGTAFYIYESSYIPNKSLKNNKTSVRAIVLPKKARIKHAEYYFYEYSVDNKKYIGRGRYHLNESVTVGDTIIIVYDKKIPIILKRWMITFELSTIVSCINFLSAIASENTENLILGFNIET